MNCSHAWGFEDHSHVFLAGKMGEGRLISKSCREVKASSWSGDDMKLVGEIPCAPTDKEKTS
ncbi:MAG: hypothetical protein QG653_126 [Patescibacteria group bacterium]|nr:hypothetical protein [Patescibacteria group bacterium]